MNSRYGVLVLAIQPRADFGQGIHACLEILSILKNPVNPVH